MRCLVGASKRYTIAGATKEVGGDVVTEGVDVVTGGAATFCAKIFSKAIRCFGYNRNRKGVAECCGYGLLSRVLNPLYLCYF